MAGDPPNELWVLVDRDGNPHSAMDCDKEYAEERARDESRTWSLKDPLTVHRYVLAPAEQEAQSDGWRTMDSAPKRGCVLLWDASTEFGSQEIGWWVEPIGESKGYWTNGYGDSMPPLQPTHWQPLPAAPAGPPVQQETDGADVSG